MTEQEWQQIELDFKEWDKEGNYGASQRQILDWFKAKVFSSNAVLAESLPLSKQDLEDGMLLLTRLQHIKIGYVDEQIKRMLHLIDATGFELCRKR